MFLPKTFLMYIIVYQGKRLLNASVLLIIFLSHGEEKFPLSENLSAGTSNVTSEDLTFVLRLMSRQRLTLYHFTWTGSLLSLFQHPPVNSILSHILYLRKKKPGARTFLLITSSCHQKISLFEDGIEVIHKIPSLSYLC